MSANSEQNSFLPHPFEESPIQKKLDNYIIEDRKLHSELEESLLGLNNNLNELTIKFDVWNSHTSTMVSNAHNLTQSSINYATCILTVIAIAFAVGVFFIVWDKRKAIKIAQEELKTAVLTSADFKKVIVDMVVFTLESNTAEKERALRNNYINTSENETQGPTEEISSRDIINAADDE